MKKRTLSMILAAAMVAGSLMGCGGSTSASSAAQEPAAEAPAAEAPAAEAEAAPAEVEGTTSVLNVYCWNEEFKSRVKDHYPGYEEIDATTGKIGDVKVVWNITPNENNAYQNNLDENLLKQEEKAADEKIDLFLIEADYALKYVGTDFAMPIADLGITEDELANQYGYTKDVVTDANGVLRGVSWQGCPGVMIYSRDVAKEVFGSDEPADIQAKFSDWDAFVASAKELKDKGYQVVSSVNDTYRVYSNNVTSPWVVDGKINLDANIKKWVDDSKALVDAGYAGTHDLWSDDWSKGFYPEGKVFAYFGPAWLIDFVMAADTEGSIAHAGGWAATEGPQGFNWGGTWICGAVGTDNPTLVKDIILAMTTDNDIMKDIAQKDTDCVNNREVLAELAADDSGNVALLGGQNPYGVLSAGAELIDMKNISSYDQGCNEKFQQVMKGYFDGTSTLEEALAQFDSEVKTLYPALA